MRLCRVLLHPWTQHPGLRQCLPAWRDSEQAALFHRTRNLPEHSLLSRKTPESAIIFRVADHDQRFGFAGMCLCHHGVHQRFAIAIALSRGQNGDRPNHDERMRAPGVVHQCDRPALQQADKYTFVIKARKAQLRQPAHSPPDRICGAAMTIRPERGIEHLFNRLCILGFEGEDCRHVLLFCLQMGMSAREAAI